MKRWLTVGAMLVCICSPDTGAVAPGQVAETLSQLLTHPLEQGNFSQQKTIVGLPLALASSGQFSLRADALYWQTLTPFESETRFTSEAIEQWQSGKRVWSMSRAEQPVVAVVSELMRALVKGDVDALLQHFSVGDFAVRDGCWQLALSIDDKALQQAIAGVNASGCARVEVLHVTEANGNSTRIELSAVE